MTLTVVGGTSKADQREAWYQARKKFSDIKLELPEGVIGPIFNDEYGDVYRAAVRRQGRRRRPGGARRRRRGHQAAPAQGADGQEGRHLRQAGRSGSTSSSRTSASPRSASRRCRLPKACRNQNSVLASGSIDTRSDRVLVRVTGQFDDRGRHPQRADRGRRPLDQARRLHHRHARLRGSADLHRAPQRPAGADARHRDDRRRQHRRARQGDRERQSPRSSPSFPTASSSSASPTSPRSSARRSGSSSARCWKRSRSCSP